MPTANTNKTKVLRGLSKELARVASALERQNSVKRRFFMGVVFGVGTAIGASLIASVIVLIMVRALSVVGLDVTGFGQDVGATIEQQIKLQTPQD